MDRVPANLLQVLVLTYNEEANIGRVLDRLHWVDRVVVVDSFSTDATLEIIGTYTNTSVYQRAFDTHANQWNYGLDICNSRWILSLDADYVVSAAFAAEIGEKISNSNTAAFEAKFNFLVFGKPLRSNNTTPRPVLFQKELCKYYDDGHTQRLRINGNTEMFSNKMDHDDRKPLSRWLSNQASYSIKECTMLTSTPAGELSILSKIRKTKVVAPFLVFFYCLFIQGLILDGWRGWHYTLQRTMVEMLFSLRLIEHDHFKK